ncbi:hypothetical protein [Streptomyces sp. NPDC054797]
MTEDAEAVRDALTCCRPRAVHRTSIQADRIATARSSDSAWVARSRGLIERVVDSHATTGRGPLGLRPAANTTAAFLRIGYDDEPPEHQRYAQYLQALDSVAEADEANLLAAVLRGDDTSMAESAVNHHLERRAAEQLTRSPFPAWAQMMATVIGDHAFLTRRPPLARRARTHPPCPQRGEPPNPTTTTRPNPVTGLLAGSRPSLPPIA